MPVQKTVRTTESLRFTVTQVARIGEIQTKEFKITIFEYNLFLIKKYLYLKRHNNTISKRL